MTKLAYPELGDIPHTAKEAVAAAILYQTNDRLRGAGAGGRIIYREKPSKVLHTQLLLPRRKPSITASSYLEKDDVTSPSHIGTAGLTFQIADQRSGFISVTARCCIYLRMLPSVHDLANQPVVFRIGKDARSVILRHRRQALKAAEEQNKAILEEQGTSSAAWHAIKAKAVEDAQSLALLELGIAASSLTALAPTPTLESMLNEQDELPDGDDPSASTDPTTDKTEATLETTLPDPAIDGPDASDSTNQKSGDGDTLNSLEFRVVPGATNAPPEKLIEKEHIPHKWIRLPVNLGTLELTLSGNAEDIERSIAEFNDSMRARLEAAIDQWLADQSDTVGGALWAFPKGSGKRSRMVTAGEVVAWGNTLQALRANHSVARPTILPILEFENLEDPLRSDERTIRIILANESDLPEPDTAEARETDATLYQVELAVQFSPGLHRPITLERIKPSYRYNQFLTHDALGINCGVRRRRMVEADVLEITTLPIYFQPLVRQFEIAPAPLFKDLGGPDGGLAVLKSLAQSFKDWLAQTVASKPFEQSLDRAADAASYAREKRQFEDIDLPAWQAEIQSIERGISILERAGNALASGKSASDPEVIPLTAWRFMNQTFERFWAAKTKKVTAWRLFQIAFIVSQIPALVSRIDAWKNVPGSYSDHDDRDATLLYFSTGGGKSESFFGLLVFTLALDRLRGKVRGVSALVRYPLRLLTSQQAYRLSQILAAAHKIKWEWTRKELELPGRDFEIGFWVGGNNTPNNPSVRGISEIPRLTGDWDELSVRRGDYVVYLKKWSRLPNCPFCNSTLESPEGKRSSTIGLRMIAEGHEETRLAHVCFNKRCEWNVHHKADSAPFPLPIHIMDSDIYAYTPAILLGTVDKLALIGQSARTIARVLGMFGFPAWHHSGSGRVMSPYTREQFRKGPHAFGCEPLFPFYRDGKKLFFDPYPALEVQDEAHLLDESLGTFSGLFETTFQHALRKLAPLLGDRVVSGPAGIRPPRIVAASATVSEPERQIDQIYQRSVSLFPRSGPDLYESFYVRMQQPSSGDPERDSSANGEYRTPSRRRYVSLMTNGRTHTAATVAVLSSFHLTISKNLKSLIDGDESERWKTRNELADCLPDDIFQRGHRVALLDPEVSHAQIAAILNLNRIALLYVTNKKGGDNVKAALQDVVRRDHRLAGFEDMPGVKTALITGAIDAGLIGRIVTEAATQPAPGTPFEMSAIRDSLRCVIATSAISHGVDVDEFNMMFFAGQPADIAEYIQASSRVGRAHVGTSILIPTPQQRRDRYIVEIHDIFHRFLERMIDAAPVERWAENAINRTLASFLQLKLCGVDYITNMNNANTAADKAALAEPDNVGEIGLRSSIDHINLIDELRQFVVDGVGLYHATSPINKEFYKQRIHDLFDGATQAMEQSNWKNETLDTFFRQPACPLARPMTSLRDVNEAGRIEGGLGQGADKIKRSDIGRVMSALMRGNNVWTTGEAGE